MGGPRARNCPAHQHLVLWFHAVLRYCLCRAELELEPRCSGCRTRDSAVLIVTQVCTTFLLMKYKCGASTVPREAVNSDHVNSLSGPTKRRPPRGPPHITHLNLDQLALVFAAKFSPPCVHPQVFPTHSTGLNCA